MANPQKRKGDVFERDILKVVQDSGFPAATRTRPGRTEDQGDIHLQQPPEIILQCKDVRTPNWTEWLKQLEDQKRNAKARIASLVWKRSRPGKAPLYLVVLPLSDFLELIRDKPAGPSDRNR